MSVSNKILLYKTILKPVLLYGFRVWDSAANFNLQIIRTVQNKALMSITESWWYVRNDTIHRNLKINPIRTSIWKLITKFFDNLHAIPNEIFLMKSSTMRCIAVVGCLALPYFFLLLLNPNFLVPAWLSTLFRVSKLSRWICCSGNSSILSLQTRSQNNFLNTYLWILYTY